MPTPMTFEYHLSAVRLDARETAKQSLSQTTKKYLEVPMNEVDYRTLMAAGVKEITPLYKEQFHVSVLILEKY